MHDKCTEFMFAWAVAGASFGWLVGFIYGFKRCQREVREWQERHQQGEE